jgi:ubiquinone/menaquinone biosynthesis C-methylase UbiE
MAQMIRQAHASLDVSSRRKKAEKIDRLLQLDRFLEPIHLLEIGCGSGVIAHYFAVHPDIKCHVSAVDVLDQRVDIDSYHFQLVQGSQLPFDDGSFDVVISNHVIEHVGDDSEQLIHLSEIRRVMKPQGSAYLAVPNRWMLTEPHYQLPFLSWLPTRLRSPYLRISGKGLHYDCQPLSARAFEKLAFAAGLFATSLVLPALSEMLNNEIRSRMLSRAVALVPKALLDRCATFSPTLIYLLHKDQSAIPSMKKCSGV